ncbi:DUF2768 domain-containing protein [Bacillaceae bacterium S4-13-58]
MSRAMLNMYISFAGIIFMFLAIGLIMLSRYRLKGVLQVLTTILAYICMILSGLIIFYVVISGPSM